MAAVSIAEQIKAFLEEAWSKNVNDPWFYTKALGTKFVEFVTFSEKVFKTFAGRINALEQQQAEIMKALKMEPAPQEQAPPAQENGTATNGNGNHAPPPAPTAPVDVRGMVRLDSENKPMSPEDQKVEEEADLKIYGKIDESRYAPRSAFPQLRQ